MAVALLSWNLHTAFHFGQPGVPNRRIVAYLSCNLTNAFDFGQPLFQTLKGPRMKNGIRNAFEFGKPGAPNLRIVAYLS